MKPEDRKRLKQHIEMIVEHKEPEEIVRENFKQLQDEVTDLREKNIKLRLDLQTLRFKESQENRFVWWVYQVYARNVLDLVQSVPVMCPCDTEEDVPFIELAARIKEYTEHIYDGTYLDTAMSTEQSNSDVSMTQDVLTDIKTPQSIENTNRDYYKQEEENKSRLVYIVTMYRYGDREKHSYVLGAFSTENDARECGEKEKDYRGGKYEPEIIKFYVDSQRIDDFVGDSDHEHDDRIL